MTHPQSTKGQHVCERCGTAFTDYRHPERRFCSQRCNAFARPRPIRPIADRFWEKVDRTGVGCWLWLAALNLTGYGVFNLGTGKGNALAHRYAYELTHGPIPDGLFVCHHCDTPTCCNPAHLFLGTNSDNMQDASRKGRVVIPHHKGTAHKLAKLTDDAVREIRACAAAGESQRSLAARFGYTQAGICRVVNRLSWAHVE